VVLKEVTPLEMLELALIENIQRQDLNSLEEALAYQALISDFGLTQEQVAKQVGKDRSTITNSLRPCNWPPGCAKLDHATGKLYRGSRRAAAGGHCQRRRPDRGYGQNHYARAECAPG